MRHFIHTIHETSLSSMKKASLDGTFLCKSKKKGWRRWEFVRRQERNGRWKYKYVLGLAEYWTDLRMSKIFMCHIIPQDPQD